MGGDRGSEAFEATILGWLEDLPDLFLSEIVGRLVAAGIKSSESGIARLLGRHEVTRKKDRRRGTGTRGHR